MVFNETLNNIENYVAGKTVETICSELGVDIKDVAMLSSNENQLGPSKLVTDTIKDSLQFIHLYPDDFAYSLKVSLASRYCVDIDNIIIGAGSDQIIEFCLHIKSIKNAKALMCGITFSMYEIYSKMFGLEIIKTKSNFHDLDEFYEEYTKHSPQIIFLCVPNNPIGECLNGNDIMNFLYKIDSNCLVVIDGAYQEYASYIDEKKAINPSELVDKFSNVIYLGTFSKVYALASMRIGYGIASKKIIEALMKVRPPFNVSSLALVAAKEALNDKEHLDNSLRMNKEQMKRYVEFAKINNIDYVESYGNFITYFLKDSIKSYEICEYLLKRGVIIRDLKSYGINAIRITIGTDSQNSRFFNIFNEFLAEL